MKKTQIVMEQRCAAVPCPSMRRRQRAVLNTRGVGGTRGEDGSSRGAEILLFFFTIYVVCVSGSKT